jgi:hypothetical protein
LPSTVNVANIQATTLTVDSIEIDPTGASLNQVLKYNGSKFIAANDATVTSGISYEEVIGNNTDSTFTITHNLGTKDLVVAVRENVSPYDVVEVRWEATTTNTITLDFSSAPNTNSKRVAIKGPGTKQFYSTTIGDGSNSTIIVNHNLGSRNVVPVVRNVDSPFEVVEVLSYATSINSVTFDFSTAPSSASLLASVYLLDVDNSYFTTVGNNSSTEFTITHNLDTRDIGVTCRSAADPYEFIPIRWEATTVNTAKVIFAGAPTLNSRKIGIYKAVGGIKTFNDEVTLSMLDDVNVTTPSNGQFLSWDGTNWVNASAPGGAGINLLAIGSNIVPAVDNTYSLGNTSLRWQSISIGGGTIYITDSGNNNQVALTVNNGVFNIDGIAQAQLSNIAVTNLTFSDSTVQTTAAIGIPAGGLNTQILSKSADTDYAVQWVNEAPAASFTSQVKYLVKNDDSVTLTKGMVVYTSGANGDNILVKRAIATSEVASSQVLGFVENNISVNATGYVVNNGLVSNINTNSASAAGDSMWLSPTTAGGVVYGVANKPDAPNHIVYLGVVNRKNANVGQVFVHINNGWELDELHNVSASAPASGDFLKYDGTKWVNDPINLGTDTVGNYMSDVSASTGISISHTPGEGSTATISAAAPMALTQSANNASYPLTVSSANQQAGGAGYSDILKLVNSKSGATNINKFLRIKDDGQLEIINSAYTAGILLLSDAGALTVSGPINQSNYNAGDVIKATIWSASDMSFASTYTQATNSYTTIASKSYTPASSSSYLFFEVYARYYVNGAAEDSFFSQLTWNNIEIAAQRQYWSNGAGGGTRSSTLFPIAGRVTNSGGGGFTFAINARRDSADDTLSVYADNAFYVKITEVAR